MDCGLRIAGSGRRVQRLLDVLYYVLGVLAADAEADEPFRDPRAWPARAALRHRVDAAEARRLRDELAPGEEALGAVAALERERDDRAEAAHLVLGDPVRRVVVQTGKSNLGAAGAELEPLGERERGGGLTLEADLGRRERAVREPDLERARD